MGFLDIARGQEADDDGTEVDGGTADAEESTESTENTESSRRLWPVALAIVAIAVVGYLVSRQRAAREAEFTEIELEPTESESESESASTE
jgi:hypothetical protein